MTWQWFINYFSIKWTIFCNFCNLGYLFFDGRSLKFIYRYIYLSFGDLESEKLTWSGLYDFAKQQDESVLLDMLDFMALNIISIMTLFSRVLNIWDIYFDHMWHFHHILILSYIYEFINASFFNRNCAVTMILLNSTKTHETSRIYI